MIEGLLANLKLTQRVAIIPQDKGAWTTAIHRATAVISQDGGFVHVSNIRRGVETVLTFSPEDSAQIWSAPGQSYVTFFSTLSQTRPFHPVAFWKSVEEIMERARLRTSSGDPCGDYLNSREVAD